MILGVGKGWSVDEKETKRCTYQNGKMISKDEHIDYETKTD
jgi:hypothetical protein